MDTLLPEDLGVPPRDPAWGHSGILVPDPAARRQLDAVPVWVHFYRALQTRLDGTDEVLLVGT